MHIYYDEFNLEHYSSIYIREIELSFNMLSNSKILKKCDCLVNSFNKHIVEFNLSVF